MSYKSAMCSLGRRSYFTKWILTLLIMGQPLNAVASTLVVPDSARTIQASIDRALDGDTIMLPPGKYSGPGNRDITWAKKHVVVMAAEGPGSVVIDIAGSATNPHRAFYLPDRSASLTLSGVTLINGFDWFYGGAIYKNGGTLELIKCEFRRNVVSTSSYGSPAGYGGAVGAVGTDVRIIDCHFEGNSARVGNYLDASLGGALWLDSSSVTIHSSIFESDSAVVGGAVYCDHSFVEISDSYFVNNWAQATGGAAWFAECTTRVQFSIFIRNFARSGFGLTLVSSEAVVQNCSFNANSGTIPDPESGTITAALSDVSLISSIMSFTQISRAVRSYNASVLLTHCNLFGNQDGDWVGEIAHMETTNGNFSSNPRYCDTTNLQLEVESNSPCAPLYSPNGKLVGAGSVGCSNCCEGNRGEIDGDISLVSPNVGDLTYLVAYLFNNGAPPVCPEEADVDRSGSINPPSDINDLTMLVAFLFMGVAELPPCGQSQLLDP